MSKNDKKYDYSFKKFDKKGDRIIVQGSVEAALSMKERRKWWLSR